MQLIEAAHIGEWIWAFGLGVLIALPIGYWLGRGDGRTAEQEREIDRILDRVERKIDRVERKLP